MPDADEVVEVVVVLVEVEVEVDDFDVEDDDADDEDDDADEVAKRTCLRRRRSIAWSLALLYTISAAGDM